jgi:2-desacetyl-2-hydroxyethyl bacteriochlorophyllide A dehydrogenase
MNKKTMIAAVYNGGRELGIKELPIKDVKDNEVLIKVESATICGTDLHILHKKFEAYPPVVLGHEFAGRVVRKGAKVHNCSEGDLVGVEPHIYCGLCKYCRLGKPNLCLDRKAWGINMDGGFAQYVVCRMDTVYQVPNGIGSENAALMEMIGCCLNGIERIQIELGDTAVILGGGAAGIVLAKLAKSKGAVRILFSEVSEYKRNILPTMGYEEIINPHATDLKEIVMAATGGLGADVVIEASGNIQAGQTAIDLAGRNGRILFFGVAPPGEVIQIEPNIIFSKELTILGSIRNPFTHYKVLEYLKTIDLSMIISHRFPLRDINTAMELAENGRSLKVCIKPNQ